MLLGKVSTVTSVSIMALLRFARSSGGGSKSKQLSESSGQHVPADAGWMLSAFQAYKCLDSGLHS